LPRTTRNGEKILAGEAGNDLSGGACKGAQQVQVDGLTVLSQDIARHARAAATLLSHTELLAQLAHAVTAIFGGTADFVIGYTVTDTNVHGYSCIGNEHLNANYSYSRGRMQVFLCKNRSHF
jgi:hypothetical protein